MTTPEPHELLLGRLATRHRIDAADEAAIRTLPCPTVEVLPNAYLGRERQQPMRCSFILSGYAIRQKLALNGGRQIVGVLMAGDFTDLQQLLLNQADHNVQALTRLVFADIPVAALRKVADHRPNIARALWIDTLIENSMTREAVLNIGRRNALPRVAHLLCEFAARLKAAGRREDEFELPMTQEQLGDATGLTSVHINRVLRQLEKDGLVTRKARNVAILDWRGLSDLAGFDPLYLHLDQLWPEVVPAARA